MAQQKFRIGQRVYWHDPDDGLCSGWFRIRTVEQFDAGTVLYGISHLHNTEGSTAAFEYELTGKPTLMGKCYAQRNMSQYHGSYFRSIHPTSRRIYILKRHRNWHRPISLLCKFPRTYHKLKPIPQRIIV